MNRRWPFLALVPLPSLSSHRWLRHSSAEGHADSPRQERPTEQRSYRSHDDRVSRVDPEKVRSRWGQSRPGVVARERFFDRSTQRRRAATNLLVEARIVTDSRVGVLDSVAVGHLLRAKVTGTAAFLHGR